MGRLFALACAALTYACFLVHWIDRQGGASPADSGAVLESSELTSPYRQPDPAKSSSTRCWLSSLFFFSQSDYSASAAILKTQEAQTPSTYPSHELSISTASYRSALPHTGLWALRADEVGLSSVSSVTIALRRCHHSRERIHRHNRMSPTENRD